MPAEHIAGFTSGVHWKAIPAEDEEGCAYKAGCPPAERLVILKTWTQKAMKTYVCLLVLGALTHSGTYVEE